MHLLPRNDILVPHVGSRQWNQGTLVWAVQDVAVGTWIDLDSISGNQGNNWIEVVEDLSAYANKTIQIRFTSTKSAVTIHNLEILP